MRVAVYPFPSNHAIADNLHIIETAICQASAQHVRLLAFHECSLCGYPPIECDINSIKPSEIEHALNRIAELARKHSMYIAVGTIRFDKKQRFNGIVLFDDCGNRAGCYDKTALWGWDLDHFTRGSQPGIFEIDGMTIGLRICFDVRFPELFRTLYKEKVELCIVAFNDTSQSPDPERYNIIKSHLITRAAENAMTVVSVNSLSNHPAAPTGVFGPDGRTLAESTQQELLVFDYEPPQITFSMKGRITNSDLFLNSGGFKP